MVNYKKSGFAVKTRRNLCLVRCVRKSRCLPMFRISRRIPRVCAYLGYGRRIYLGRGATWVVGLVCF